MAFRDDGVVLKERIDLLELQLAKTAGRAMQLGDERDALREELERLTRDPKALARVRRDRDKRSALYTALRLLGATTIVAVLVPMIALVVSMASQGDIGAAFVCGVVPFLTVAGTILLKLPEIVQALELRFERKEHARRAAELARPRAQVRVETTDEVEVEAGEPHDADRAMRFP
jgi:hypothetical protein